MKNDLRSINGKYLFVFLVYCIDDKDCPTEHTCTTGLICKRLEGNFWYSWNIALYLISLLKLSILSFKITFARMW